MKTKRAVFSSLLLLIFTVPVLGQTKVDSLRRTETPLTFSSYFNPYNNLSDTYFFSELNNLRINSYSIDDSASIWMRTRMQLSGMYDRNNLSRGMQSNFLDALSQQYTASQSLKTLRNILGAVQVGAVGYLAYQHLKKYGFLKKK
ncbi:MAG: hypothetical protein NTX65_10580 [Ignavibacteriales bacterium]|nr:hypothetical protein [Ignavibacteriales bacterium]